MNTKHDPLTEMILAIALMPFHIFWCGVVFLCLWGWFVVPLGAPNISLLHSVGLWVFVAYVRPSGTSTEPKPVLKQYAMHFAYGALTLFLGWIIHWFMVL